MSRDEKWFESLGYSYNPFILNPLDFEDELLIGMEEEAKELLYRVKAGSMVFIEGKEGSGKTVLLKHVIDNFKGEGKVVYLDANKVNKTEDIEKILFKKGKKKGMILLLDNVSSLSKHNSEKIKYLFDEDFIKSVVFTGESFGSAVLSESIKQRIGSRIIKVPEMEEDDAV